jgi:hypothetical protein
MEQLALEKAAQGSERSSAPHACEHRLRRIAEHLQGLDNDEEEEAEDDVSR